MRTLFAMLAVAASMAVTAAPAAAAPPIPGSDDGPSRSYYDLLLQHTRWAETTWDEAGGSYKFADYDFAVVLGNAVLLKFGTYDAQKAGISYDALRDHTLRTIDRFAASNRYVDPNGNWGGTIFWDATFESYFIAAAEVLWDDLDPATRANIDRIATGEADYMAGLRDTEDPRSPGWSSNGLLGGYIGDSKIEEMGAKTMPLATGLAHAPNAPGAANWREWLDRWTMSMAGLPPADRANPALVDGRAVSDWTAAQNVYDSFLVENHGSLAPMYQESTGAYPGRNAVHFLLNGTPMPQSQRAIPNGDELAFALDRLGTDAGVPEDLMVADRHHLYGRNVLPIAYRSVVLGDAYAARAEQMLIDRLGPYVSYPPADRLTKFSGEPKYEPEARAEVAMAYLLHYGRQFFGGGARPVSTDQWFRGRSGTTDFGAATGVIAQQSPRALAAAVSKAGFTKFAYLPQHDDWFLDGSGTSPSLLPSVGLKVTGRSAHEYRKARDGFDATATLLRTSGGWAGYTTLPDGEAVYATSGLGADEGALRLYNLDMPGVPGLDGDRTFTAAGGSATLAATSGLGDGGVDDVQFAPVTARYVRFIGARPATQYGYSLFDFEVHSDDGPDLAHGAATTASSYDPTSPGPFLPQYATDGDSTTRWAVAKAERSRPDSWLAVDLGTAQSLDHVVLRFESAYAAEYRVQVSDDGSTWRDVASVPETRTFDSPWLNVDGRAGFVVRGSTNPIKVGPGAVTLSAGPAAAASGMVVEARPAEAPGATAAAAARPAPTGGPAALRASLAGGYLSLFNLSDAAVQDAEVKLPVGDDHVPLFRGTQRTADGGTVYDASLGAADARVEPPRFRLQAKGAQLEIAVGDSRSVEIRNLGDHVALATLTSVATGQERLVAVPAKATRSASFGGPLTPSADLARARVAFPTSPLPAGTTDPERALDGDPATTWTPGSAKRMVIDLGAQRTFGAVALHWTHGKAPAAQLSVSSEGKAYTPIAAQQTTGRYVAIAVPGWTPGDPVLADAEVMP